MYRLGVGRYNIIGLHVDISRHSDSMSTDTRLIQCILIGWYVNRYILADTCISARCWSICRLIIMLTDTPVECRPICRSTYWSRGAQITHDPEIFVKICWQFCSKLLIVHTLHYANEFFCTRQTLASFLKNVWQKSGDPYSLSMKV